MLNGRSCLYYHNALPKRYGINTQHVGNIPTFFLPTTFYISWLAKNDTILFMLKSTYNGMQKNISDFPVIFCQLFIMPNGKVQGFSSLQHKGLVKGHVLIHILHLSLVLMVLYIIEVYSEH